MSHVHHSKFDSEYGKSDEKVQTIAFRDIDFPQGHALHGINRFSIDLKASEDVLGVEEFGLDFGRVGFRAIWIKGLIPHEKNLEGILDQVNYYCLNAYSGKERQPYVMPEHIQKQNQVVRDMILVRRAVQEEMVRVGEILKAYEYWVKKANNDEALFWQAKTFDGKVFVENDSNYVVFFWEDQGRAFKNTCYAAKAFRPWWGAATAMAWCVDVEKTILKL